MTIAIDTSALVSILNVEVDAPAMATCLGSAPRKLLSTANYLECGIVIGKLSGSAGLRRMRRLLMDADVEIVPVEVPDAELALEAYRRFGKGSGHPARLNFGDCFAYALAKGRDLPLLFKGDDFSRTDVHSALVP